MRHLIPGMQMTAPTKFNLDGSYPLSKAHEEKGNPSLPDSNLENFSSLPSFSLNHLSPDKIAKETMTYPIFDRGGKVARIIEAAVEDSGLRESVEGKTDDSFCGIISRSDKMKTIFRLIRQVAASDAPILIYGETGVGKELTAQAIHQNSARREGPFVTIDCGSLTETLLESELFGHVRGAFTGAVQKKKGLFEEAQGGTLFLDEIGDASLALQAKLLRALQEGETRPVGGTRNIKLDVRVVAATNKHLREAVARKNFRQDLYYRLAVVSIAVPPLRQRPEDIALLAQYFLDRYTARNRKEKMSLSEEAVMLLSRLRWPGNIRELENVIKRAAIVSPHSEILPEALPIAEEIDLTNDDSAVFPVKTMGENLAEVERERIIDALTRYDWNKSLSARRLGISRSSLYNKLKQYEITPPT